MHNVWHQKNVHVKLAIGGADSDSTEEIKFLGVTSDKKAVTQHTSTQKSKEILQYLTWSNICWIRIY